MLIIEGQIGVGKTTLGQFLEKALGMKLYLELGNALTEGFLDKFYADKKRWAFALQVHFLNERFGMIKEIFHQGGGILDRSLFGDRVFADVLYQEGNMTHEEYQTYISLLDNMLEHVQNPSLLIYLDCDVEIAMERIKKRSRGLEASIEKKYLQDLHQHYLEWYQRYTSSPKIFLPYSNFDIFDQDQQKELVDKIRHAL